MYYRLTVPCRNIIQREAVIVASPFPICWAPREAPGGVEAAHAQAQSIRY